MSAPLSHGPDRPRPDLQPGRSDRRRRQQRRDGVAVGRRQPATTGTTVGHHRPPPPDRTGDHHAYRQPHLLRGVQPERPHHRGRLGRHHRPPVGREPSRTSVRARPATDRGAQLHVLGRLQSRPTDGHWRKAAPTAPCDCGTSLTPAAPAPSDRRSPDPPATSTGSPIPLTATPSRPGVTDNTVWLWDVSRPRQPTVLATVRVGRLLRDRPRDPPGTPARRPRHGQVCHVPGDVPPLRALEVDEYQAVTGEHVVVRAGVRGRQRRRPGTVQADGQRP